MSRRAEKAHAATKEGARKRGRLALDDVDFDATSDEFDKTTKEFKRSGTYAPGVATRFAFDEGQLVEIADQWLRHHSKQDATLPPAGQTRLNAIFSSPVPSGRSWRQPAAAQSQSALPAMSPATRQR